MSDDQERRIAELERHIERLFELHHTAAERLASLDTFSIRLEKEMEKSAQSMVLAVNEIKMDITRKQEESQKRATTTLTIIFFTVSTIISPLVAHVFQALTK